MSYWRAVLLLLLLSVLCVQPVLVAGLTRSVEVREGGRKVAEGTNKVIWKIVLE